MKLIKHTIILTEDRETGRFYHTTLHVDYAIVSEDVESYVVRRGGMGFTEVVYKEPSNTKINELYKVSSARHPRNYTISADVWLPEGEDITPYYKEVIQKEQERVNREERRLKEHKKGLANALKQLVK